MCGDAIESFVESVGNYVADSPLVTTVANVVGPVFGLPRLGDLLGGLHDYSKVDDGDFKKPPGDPKNLGQELPEGLKKAPLDVLMDNFAGVSYQSVYDKLASADRDVAPGFSGKWADIARNLGTAVGNFEQALAGIESGADAWVGTTHDAALNNVNTSLSQVRDASRGADAMSRVVDVYSRTITTAMENIVDNYSNYTRDLAAFPEHQDEVKQNYATFAQGAMNDGYVPYMSAAAANNPAFSAGAPPPLGTPGGDAPGIRGAGGGSGPGAGGGPGGGGAAKAPGGAGMPKRPEFASLEAVKPKAPNGNPTKPSAPSMPSVPTDALGGIGDAAKDAAGQLADAAQGALGQAMNAANPGGAGMPPEGVLGLGPNGLKGATTPKMGGAGGGRGAGGGPAGGGASARPAGVPSAAAAANKTAGTPVSATRAGLSSAAGAGSPGAGAPAGGQRGGGADGKEHKAMKALRRKKNGEQVMGESDAVVAVVGDEAVAAQPAAQPGTS